MRRYEGAMRHGMRFVKVKEEETAATHKGSARWQLEK
jgi:hypothetical protein